MTLDDIASDLRRISAENAEYNPVPKKQLEYDRAFLDLQSQIVEMILKMRNYGNFSGRKILDVGCAYGTIDACLRQRGYAVTAIDNVDWYANPAWLREMWCVDWQLCNVETDQIPGKPYDTIIFSEVLEHLGYSPIPVMKKLFKALRPGGVLYLSTPMKETGSPPRQYNPRYASLASYKDIPKFTDYEPSDAEHYYYSQQELIDLLRDAGFELKLITSSRGGAAHFIRADKP